MRRGGAPGCTGLVGGKVLLTLQGTNHVDHVARVVSAARQILCAQTVGLQLLIAPVGGDVARRCRLRHVAGQLPGTCQPLAFQHGTQYRGRQHTQARILLARGALGTMAGGDVANLMAHHAGQFSLTLQIGHDAARHIHITAWQREGIDLGAVQQGEVPLQLVAVRQLGQALTQVVDVSLQFGV